MAYHLLQNRGVNWDAYWRPPVVPLSPIYRLNPYANRLLEYRRTMPIRLAQVCRYQPPPLMPPLRPMPPPPQVLPPPPPVPHPVEQRPRTEQQRVPVEKVAMFKSKSIPDAFIVLLAENGVRSAKLHCKLIDS